jgi:oligosaccharide repeat unit polymerase
VSAAAASLAIPHDRRLLPAALFELLVFAIVVAAASLAFVAGWLSVNAAVVLTVILLVTLIVLSWIHLGQGRHPVFLFLCTLTLFQGGRLIAFCLGSLSDPFQIDLLVGAPYAVPRQIAGLVMICLSLSALCLYAPCRWSYRQLPPPDVTSDRKYLPYLYLVFYSALPFLIYKNYLYLSYIQSHGGYIAFYTSYKDLSASVPLFVRVVALLPLPVLVMIFVFENRKKVLYITVFLYLCTSVLFLLTGARIAVFGMVLTLWFLERVKSTRKSRLWRLALFGAALVLVAIFINLMRSEEAVNEVSALNPVKFIAIQGVSVAVTEVAIQHRDLFQPYSLSYHLHELELEFVASDVSSYFRGRQLGYDVSAFLSPYMFGQGLATGGSLIAEAYVMGGVLGVTVISLLLGFVLRLLYLSTVNPKVLVLVALSFTEVLLMPRGYLLGPVSALARSLVLLLPIALGWTLFRFLGTSLRPSSAGAR